MGNINFKVLIVYLQYILEYFINIVCLIYL